MRQWEIDITIGAGVGPVAEGLVSETVRDILNALSEEPIPNDVSEISVVLADDQILQGLNRDYRDKDSPTDVLSFAQLEGEAGPTVTLGDIVISIETCKRQAPEFNNSPDQELTRLLIHGILHLLGYDHEDVPESEVIRMQEQEDRLFAEIDTKRRAYFSS